MVPNNDRELRGLCYHESCKTCTLLLKCVVYVFVIFNYVSNLVTMVLVHRWNRCLILLVLFIYLLLFFLRCVFNSLFNTCIQNVKIDNFAESFSDGLAFCALMHHFIPDQIAFSTLTPNNRVSQRLEGNERGGAHILTSTVEHME